MLYLDFVMVHLDYDFWGGLTFYSLDTLRYNKCFQITMSVVIQAVYALKKPHLSSTPLSIQSCIDKIGTFKNNFSFIMKLCAEK